MNSLFARFLYRLAALLGALAWALGIRRAVALDGLARAFPELSDRERRALGRRSHQQLARTLAEIVVSRNVSDEALAEWVRFEGFERYQAAAAEGKGVVVAVAHFGNWELLGRACARRGVKLTTITRRLRGRVNAWFLAVRKQGGMQHLPDRDATGQALALLRRGEVLGIAVDQNMMRRRGIFVDFFGVPACTTPAAAVYSLRSGAPLLGAFPVRDPDGRHRVIVLGPFAPAPGTKGHDAILSLTRQYTDAVERMIRSCPDHWLWMHRRWKTRPEGPRQPL